MVSGRLPEKSAIFPSIRFDKPRKIGIFHTFERLAISLILGFSFGPEAETRGGIIGSRVYMCTE